MRGRQYYSDDDIMVLHLGQAHSYRHTVNGIRAIDRSEGRGSANLNDLLRVANTIEGHGEEIAMRRYGLRHYHLFGIEPHLEKLRIAKAGVMTFIENRTMESMPSSLTPTQKLVRLIHMQFPKQFPPQ